MRITTNMNTTKYVKNIRRITSELDRANEVATSGRSILKGSDDAFSTINVYRLRDQARKTEIQEKTIRDVDGYLTTAESGLMGISESLTGVYESTIRGITGTMSKYQRNIVAKEIENIQQSILNSLNTQYTGKYVFGGGGRVEKPFSITDGKLHYKGIDVNDNTQLSELDKLAGEKIGVNILYGDITDNNGELTNVFDSAISSLDFLGYGTDENGIPKNIYSSLEGIKKELQNEDFSLDEISKYMDNFNEQKIKVSVAISNIGGKTNYLETIKSRNTDAKYTIQDKLAELEYVDYAEALIDFKTKEYAYTSAISMGSKILQNSIIDFMR